MSSPLASTFFSPLASPQGMPHRHEVFFSSSPPASPQGMPHRHEVFFS